MKIDIDAIDRTQFSVDQRGDWILIRPNKLKHTWRQDEVHLRSLLCDRDGNVLSSGFPKFFNYGEQPELDREFDAIDPRDITYTEKLDGSLIIRSIIDGKVHLRTRGHHELGEFEWVRALIEEKYRTILAPTNGSPGASHLFEVTAPNNQIVVRYETAALTYLGLVRHQDLRVFPANEFYAFVFGTQLVKEYEITGRVQDEIFSWRGQEGVVACTRRKNGSLLLVKFKSAWYLRAHAFRSYITEQRIKEYTYLNKVTTPEQLVRSLMGDGIDFETASSAVPLFVTVRESIDARLRAVDGATELFAYVRDLPDRKARALELKAKAADDLFPVLIHFAMGEDDKYKVARDAYSLGMGRVEFANLKRQPIVLDLDSGKNGD